MPPVLRISYHTKYAKVESLQPFRQVKDQGSILCLQEEADAMVRALIAGGSDLKNAWKVALKILMAAVEQHVHTSLFCLSKVLNRAAWLPELPDESYSKCVKPR